MGHGVKLTIHKYLKKIINFYVFFSKVAILRSDKIISDRRKLG